MTQSAVLYGFTLTTPSREPGRYGSPSFFAITPSKPAACSVCSHARPCSTSSETGESGTPFASALELGAPLLDRPLVHRLSLPEQQVECDERRRDLGGQLLHAALGRMQPHLHRVEVELALARDHDLAVERRVGRQQLADRAQLGEVPQQRPAVARPQRDLAAVVLEHAAEAVPLRLVRHAPARSGSSETSSASIGGNGTFGPGAVGRSASAMCASLAG